MAKGSQSMSKIGEIQVTIVGMEEAQRAASAVADCFGACRDAFSGLASDLAEVAADMEAKRTKDDEQADGT
jgi:hypothetical protein